MSSTEGKIQLEICRYLRKQGHLFWRFSPETYRADLKIHIKHEYIPNGLSDLMLIHPERGFMGLEVKTKTGKPSADQLLMQRRFKRHGCEYHFVRCVQDVEKLGL